MEFNGVDAKGLNLFEGIDISYTKSFSGFD